MKCTNCGHMFKIRKRAITNVGMTPSAARDTGPPTVRDTGPPTVRDPNAAARARAGSMPVYAPPRARDSMLDDDARQFGADEAPTTIDRQWLIRLESGEQKSCRELATLQQWIIAGVVTRESLISRTGKTWKRIGDIADLGQYFTIADEARANRDRIKPPSRPAPIASIKEIPGTIPGYGAAQAAGGTILPDDDDGQEARTTRAYHHGQRPPAHTPPPVPTRAVARPPVPVAAPAPISVGLLPTEVASGPTPGAPHAAPRRPRTTPPPPPPRRGAAATGPAALVQPPAIPPPQGNRATAAWATDGVKPDGSDVRADAPYVGNLGAASDEPVFAGRVRMAPGDAGSFDASRVRAMDDDDDVLPMRRSSRAGMWVLLMALLVMGAAAAVVYVFVLRTGHDEPAALPPRDAGATAVVAATPDAAQIAAPPVTADAAAVEPAVSGPRAELAADVEPRLRTAAQSLDGKLDAPSQALRAHLIARLAQDLQDRAGLIAAPDGEVLRRESKQLVLEAATAAQRALRTAGDDPGANLAMAEVLRLQGKPARDIKRYLDTVRTRPDPDKAWATEVALADALVAARDGKHEDARAAFAVIDQGDGKLESSGDVRARFHTALELAALGKPADAKPLVEAIVAAQPEHAGARALAGKLETMVARTDPLPPEDGARDGSARPGSAPTPPTRPPPTPPPTRVA
ncbi:MAG TPA: hypothetical protein VK607_00885, partial [Kofleriaceae bacterium]|nr:hypothetical protein [Kofleriaceae bacterium]